MNYPLLTLIAVWVGVMITIYVSIRSSGERDQRLRDVEKTSSEYRTWLLTHDSRLNAHDVELAETRGFRKGIEIGAKKAQGT